MTVCHRDLERKIEIRYVVEAYIPQTLYFIHLANKESVSGEINLDSIFIF